MERKALLSLDALVYNQILYLRTLFFTFTYHRIVFFLSRETLTIYLMLCFTSPWASFKFDHRRKQFSIDNLPFKKLAGYFFPPPIQ